MTQKEKLEFKFKFDKMLDDVFFTSDFRNFIVRVMHYCPNGLTINTDVDGNEPFFKVCTKHYGYDFSERERVPGDYYDLKYNAFEEKMAVATYYYLETKCPELYDEMKKTGYAMYI